MQQTGNTAHVLVVCAGPKLQAACLSQDCMDLLDHMLQVRDWKHDSCFLLCAVKDQWCGGRDVLVIGTLSWGFGQSNQSIWINWLGSRRHWFFSAVD